MIGPDDTASPLPPTAREAPLGVDEAVSQAFRSAAHAFQVQAAGLFRAGRMVAFAAPGGAMTMEQAAPAVTASTDVATRGSITRFYSPPDSDTDYVLYATPVHGDLALVAFFSMDTPLGNARRTGQAISQAILRAAPREPPPAAPPALPRDWIPERPRPEAEAALLGAPPAAPAPPVELPRDWVPSGPAAEDRLPFLQPPAARPQAAPAGAAATTPVIVSAPPSAGVPLTFSVVLLPRFPEHRLSGALVQRLRMWVHRLCLAWDWGPEHIEIRPDRLAVTLTIGAETAPAQALAQLRDGLAARVLQAYPALATDLPSGRFWATPFLLVAGPLPDEAALDRFLKQTRRAQGFSARS